MKKIVINNCWGGFGLSYEATMEFAKLKGETINGYCQKNYKGDYLKYDSFRDNGQLIHYAYSDKVSLSHKEINDKYFKSISFVERDDVDLVKVIEMLGNDANGHHAELKIVEIPDDICWTIKDYDGMESVEEYHRSWS